MTFSELNRAYQNKQSYLSCNFFLKKFLEYLTTLEDSYYFIAEILYIELNTKAF